MLSNTSAVSTCDFIVSGLKLAIDRGILLPPLFSRAHACPYHGVIGHFH